MCEEWWEQEKKVMDLHRRREELEIAVRVLVSGSGVLYGAERDAQWERFDAALKKVVR